MAAVQVPAGGAIDSPYPGVIGDFNGDGRKDVATVVHNVSQNTTVYFISAAIGNGDGTFQPAKLTSTSASEPPLVLVGDLNGDGKDDLVLCHQAKPNVSPPLPTTLEIWLSDGDGTFTSQGEIAVTDNQFASVDLVDVNGDNKPDLIIADAGNPGSVWTMLGNGNGTFQPPTSTGFQGQVRVGSGVFADFNGDGRLDFAGSDYSTNKITVYLASPAGGYDPPIYLMTSDTAYHSCFNSVGDLNGDAKPEIVSANCDDNTITVYLNNSDGTFQQGIYQFAGVYPQGLSFADVNGDGKTDIISSNQGGADVTVLLGNGDGSVETPSFGYATGGYPHTPALVADFNGDGKFDLIVPDADFSFIFLEGYGDGRFRSAMNYYSPAVSDTSNGQPYGMAIATGNFNGDGSPDFVIGNCCDSSIGITVFLSSADGSIQSGVNYGTGGSLQFVAVADFNGDGKLDIAATDYVNGVVQIFIGNGDGTFQVGPSYPTDSASSPEPDGIVAGDFNHDGKLDIAVVNFATGNVGVLMNDGQGGFLAPVNYPLSQRYSYEISAADLNSDNNIDLIVPLANGKSVAVLLGNSDGTFQNESDVNLGTSGNPFAAAIGDLNGDGNPDLAVTIDDPTNGMGIAVALGNGDGTFQQATLYASTSQDSALGQPFPAYVKMLDLDHDGKLDLVYTNSGFGTVGVMFGKGDGTFYSPVEYAAGGYAFGLALADVNGDGATDAVTAGDDFSGITVLLNASGTQTVVSSSLNPASQGQSITFSATVVPTVRGVTAVPTGTVTFDDGGTILGSVPLSSGAARFTATSLAIGTHAITAHYGGSSTFSASSSSALTEVITEPLGYETPGYILDVSPTSATVQLGGSARFTITLTPHAGYDGSVAFRCDQLPGNFKCDFNPGSVTARTQPSQIALSVNTAVAGAQLSPAGSNREGGINTAFLGLFAVLFAGNTRGRRNIWIVTILALVVILTMVGCGGSNAGQTAPGTEIINAQDQIITIVANGSAGTNAGDTSPHQLKILLTVTR